MQDEWHKRYCKRPTQRNQTSDLTDNVHPGKVVHVLLRVDDLPFPFILRGQRSRKLVVQNVVVRTARGKTLDIERVGCSPKVTSSTSSETIESGLLVLAVVVAGCERGGRGEERKDGDQNSGGQHVWEVFCVSRGL